MSVNFSFNPIHQAQSSEIKQTQTETANPLEKERRLRMAEPFHPQSTRTTDSSSTTDPLINIGNVFLSDDLVNTKETSVFVKKTLEIVLDEALSENEDDFESFSGGSYAYGSGTSYAYRPVSSENSIFVEQTSIEDPYANINQFLLEDSLRDVEELELSDSELNKILEEVLDFSSFEVSEKEVISEIPENQMNSPVEDIKTVSKHVLENLVVEGENTLTGLDTNLGIQTKESSLIENLHKATNLKLPKEIMELEELATLNGTSN